MSLGVRPQDVRVGDDPGQGDAVGRVEVVQPLGSDLLVHLTLTGTAAEVPVVVVVLAEAAGIRAEQSVSLRFARDRLHLFDARDGSRLKPAA